MPDLTHLSFVSLSSLLFQASLLRLIQNTSKVLAQATSGRGDQVSCVYLPSKGLCWVLHVKHLHAAEQWRVLNRLLLSMSGRRESDNALLTMRSCLTHQNIMEMGADPDGAFSSSSQSQAGQEQAAGMGTGGSLNPPPGKSFAGESSCGYHARPCLALPVFACGGRNAALVQRDTYEHALELTCFFSSQNIWMCLMTKDLPR